MKKMIMIFFLSLSFTVVAQASPKHKRLNSPYQSSYFEGQSNLVFTDTIHTMKALGWNIEYCNLEKGKIFATLATNPWTWMDVMYIQVEQKDENQVKITVHSDSGAISGLAPHKALVDNLYQEIGYKHHRL